MQVYRYNSSDWNLLDSDLKEGSNQFHVKFGYSVSLSYNGNTIAIGAPDYDSNGYSRNGKVQVFRYNSTNWNLLESDINGEAHNDHLGSSVSISSNGNTVAIGTPFATSGGVSDNGYVRVYEYNTSAWNLVLSLDGEATDDRFGYAVSLNNDGTTVAIGAHLNDVKRGHVQVYTVNPTQSIQNAITNLDYTSCSSCVDELATLVISQDIAAVVYCCGRDWRYNLTLNSYADCLSLYADSAYCIDTCSTCNTCGTLSGRNAGGGSGGGSGDPHIYYSTLNDELSFDVMTLKQEHKIAESSSLRGSYFFYNRWIFYRPQTSKTCILD